MSKEVKPKILCVDDEKHVLDALDRVLRADFQVLKASSGHEGLEVVQHNPELAVILTDQRMPKMTGVEFLQKARAIAPNATRAILSGQIDPQQLSEAINNAEIHRFLMKPWDNEILRLQMLEALQTHARLTEKSELLQLSITDPITHLTNHRYFQEKLSMELDKAIKGNKDLALIMVDVDHFKSYNDRYGHPEGDRLLAEVAQKIFEIFPVKGQASRYGGEEFAVVLPETDLEQAVELAENLRKGIESMPVHGPQERPAFVTISLGIASFPDHGSAPETLVSVADKALYQAKREGRNRSVIGQKNGQK